jgi:hypothetical protein
MTEAEGLVVDLAEARLEEQLHIFAPRSIAGTRPIHLSSRLTAFDPLQGAAAFAVDRDLVA